MDSSQTTSFVMFTMTFLSLSQSILQKPICKLALDILKIVYHLPPVAVAHISQTPTRTVRGPEIEVVELPPSEDIYFCAFAVISVVIGAQLLFSRRSAFFTPVFKIFVGVLAKIYECTVSVSYPLYTHSAAVTAVLELVSTPHTTVSPATADSLHNLLVIAESFLLYPLDTLLVVATVSSSSSVVAEFIFTTSALVFDCLISVDSIAISSNLLTVWAFSYGYTSQFGSGMTALVFPLAIELLMIHFAEAEVELTPDFVVENFDWEELCHTSIITLNLDVANPLNGVISKNDYANTPFISLPYSTTSHVVDPALAPAPVRYVARLEEQQSTLGEIAAGDISGYQEPSGFLDENVPNLIVPTTPEEVTSALVKLETFDGMPPSCTGPTRDEYQNFSSVDVPFKEERVAVSEPNTPRRYTSELFPEVLSPRKATSEPSYSPRIVDLPLYDDDASSGEETEYSDDLTLVELNVDMKIRKMESFVYALDYVQDLVTSTPPPLSTNPPCGKPYVWVQPTPPPRFQQRHHWPGQ